MQAPKRSRGNKRLEGYFNEIRKNKDFIDTISELTVIYNSKGYQKDESVRAEYWRIVYGLCYKYNLRPYPWRVLIEKLVKNGIDCELDCSTEVLDMCVTRDLEYEKGHPIEDIEEYVSHFPVAICISPYATLSDIRDYLNKNKELIKYMLGQHKRAPDLVNKYRKRSAKAAERNDYIFQNRDKSRKELMALVNKKYGQTLGYDDIGKIIQREKKRRGVK